MYIQNLIKLQKKIFPAKLAQVNLITKTDFANKLKLTQIKQKTFLLKMNIKKITNSIYLRGKSYFEEDSAQNYLTFQLMYRYFKNISGVGNGEYISF